MSDRGSDPCKRNMCSTFDQCLEQARMIVESYRREAVGDPKCWYVSTTLITLALVSAAVSAYGAYYSAQSQSDAAKYNAAVANNNAAAAAQQGEFDAQQIRDRNKRILAQQRNAFAAAGVDPDSGSASDVASDSAVQGELQALMAIYTGRSSQTAEQARSRLYAMQADRAQTGGYVAVGGTILSGLTTAASVDASSRQPTFIR